MVNPPLVRDVFAHPSITDTPAEQAVRRLVMDELAKLSGQAEPYAGTTVTTSSGEVGTTALVEAEKAAPAAVQRAAWAARLRAAATSLPRMTGSVGLVIGAGALGYTIGTGLNKMFFHINQPVGLSSTNVGNPDRLDYRLGATTTDSCALNGNAWMPGSSPLIATAATVVTPELGISTGGCAPGRTVALGNGAWAMHYTAGRNGGYFFYDGVNPSHSGFNCPSDQGMVGSIVLGSDGGVCEYGFSMWTLADADPSTPHAYDSATDGTVDPTRQLGALPAPTETTVTDAVNDPASTPWVDKIDDELHPDGFPVTVPAPAEDELYPDYLNGLEALGLDGHVTQATGAAIDTNKAAKAVLTVDPEAGTGVSPGTTIEVLANPDVLPEPPPTTATVPPCDGKTYEECSVALEAAGFTQHHKMTLDIDTAELDTPADQVVSLEPATGTVADTSTDLGVRTNPSAADMPVIVPDFASYADVDSYTSELERLGLQTEIVTPPPNLEPGDIWRVEQAPGARVHRGSTERVLTVVRSDPFNDPDGEPENEQDCELATPSGTDPHPELGRVIKGQPSNPAWYSVQQSFSAYGVDGGVKLLMGWTDDTKADPPGWGYRHIVAGHSWTQDDIAATAVALQNVPGPGGRGTLIYVGPQYSGNGTPTPLCQRYVVVQTMRNPEESSRDLSAKNIITSFGRRITPPSP